MRVTLLPIVLLGCQREPEPNPPADDPYACPTAWSSEVQATVDAIEADAQDQDAPSRAWAILLDGRVAACGATGTLAPGDDTPADAHTRYRIGSQTKSITAAGLLLLAQRGALNLDAPVSELVPGWDLDAQPGTAAALTPRLLLSHQGGFVDYIAIDSNSSLSPWVEGFMAEQLFVMAPPGSFYNYSNPNFMLAGYLIEQNTGIPYRDWIRDEVLTPWGMTETVFTPRDAPDAAFATGLGADWEGGSAELVEQAPRAYDNPWAAPAGYAWSSAADLARLARHALDGGDLLDTASLSAWTSAEVRTLEAGTTSAYGLGWFIEDGHDDGDQGWWDQPLLLHGGDIPGFATDVILAPEDGFGIVSVTARDAAHLDDEVLVDALRRHAPRDPVADPNPPFDPARLNDYAGTYVDPFNVGPWTFTVDGEALRMEMPLLDELDIPYDRDALPIGPHTFVIVVQDYPMLLTFIPGDDGAFKWARTRSFVAERAPDDPPEALTAAPRRAPPSLHIPPPSPIERRLLAAQRD